MIETPKELVKNPRGKANNGEVFTKPWIVEGMLDLIGYTIDKPIYNKIILEPSCGDGSFLVEIAERLLFKARLDKIPCEKLTQSILAFDINSQSLTTCKNRLINILKKYGYPKELVDGWIVNGDFLQSGLTPVDYVIGNPPYIRSKEISKQSRKAYQKTLSTMSMGTDIYIGFMEKGLRSLKKDGVLCFICSDRWMQNSYGQKLRKYVASNFNLDTIIKLSDVDAFEDSVSAYPAIFKISNSKPISNSIFYAECNNKLAKESLQNLISDISLQKANSCEEYETNLLSRENFLKDDVWILGSSNETNHIRKIDANYPSIQETGVRIGIGLATGLNKIFIVSDPDIVESDRLLPTFLPEDISDGRLPDCPIHWIVNPWGKDGKLVDLDKFPKLKLYFESHRKELMQRYIAKRNTNQWYRTIDKPCFSLLAKEKLLISDLRSKPMPYLDHGIYYPFHNFYWITSDTWNLRVLGGILMSDIIAKYLGSKSVKMNGGALRFQAQYLRKIHLPYYDSIDEKVKKELSDSFINHDISKANKAVKNLFKR